MRSQVPITTMKCYYERLRHTTRSNAVVHVVSRKPTVAWDDGYTLPQTRKLDRTRKHSIITWVPRDSTSAPKCLCLPSMGWYTQPPSRNGYSNVHPRHFRRCCMFQGCRKSFIGVLSSASDRHCLAPNRSTRTSRIAIRSRWGPDAPHYWHLLSEIGNTCNFILPLVRHGHTKMSLGM